MPPFLRHPAVPPLQESRSSSATRAEIASIEEGDSREYVEQLQGKDD